MGIYLRLVLHRPLFGLLFAALVVLFFIPTVTDFRIDASSDSLVVEGDVDLAYSRQVSHRYGISDFVFVVYTPEQELFTSEVLADLLSLRNELASLERVASVNSIFTVPLLQVAGATLVNVADSLTTLEEEGVDLIAAKNDLLSNRAYQDVLLSVDGKSTALVVNFTSNRKLADLLELREKLKDKSRVEGLSVQEEVQLLEVSTEYQQAKKVADSLLHQDIARIRTLLERHKQSADIVMGGVPMIADDLVSFVRSDLASFGLATLALIILALWFFFRRVLFVVLPIICSAVILTTVLGILGRLDWPATVISANFVSLLLIITVSLTVHLIVRYRELQISEPEMGHLERMRAVLASMLIPCFYTSLTTIVAFASLIISDIPPVVDFGLMMVVGIVVAFFLTFLIFPSLVSLQKPPVPPVFNHSESGTVMLSRFTENYKEIVAGISLSLGVLAIYGFSQLKVENSFINYFDSSTEIHRGMVTIDQRMGGTTPLDVILNFSPASFEGDDFGDDPYQDDGFGTFTDDFRSEAFAIEGGLESLSADEAFAKSIPLADENSYWFTQDKMAQIVAINDWLEMQPEIGKVLSLATLLELAYGLNEGNPLNTFELGILYKKIPEEFKVSLLQPYLSIPNDEVRFSMRVRESDPNLRRSELMDRIRHGLIAQFQLDPNQVHLSGMLVLYNNMLQSLFASQIETIAIVMGVIFVMFLVLFRSVKLAIVGIVPNILAAFCVLGLMGLLDIPLDMMTITIAAIAIGIGVDNTIHYIHRFQTTFHQSGNYLETMHYCHGSIGKGIFYTNFSIIAGFSLLVLSNFIPTVYFGLLTSLAMALALLASLTLLPLLLFSFRPLGAEKLSS